MVRVQTVFGMHPDHVLTVSGMYLECLGIGQDRRQDKQGKKNGNIADEYVPIG
jgi:hypothetical protein